MVDPWNWRRYVRPDDATIAHLLAQCLPGEAGPFELVEAGPSSLVAFTDLAAVRIARDVHAATQMLRTQQLVDHLPELPFEEPRHQAAPGGTSAAW